MRPVSIALGGVLALILASAAAAAPLKPQPSPHGRHALNPQPLPPGRQATPTVFVVCASPRRSVRSHTTIRAQGRTDAGKAHGGCASGGR